MAKRGPKPRAPEADPEVDTKNGFNGPDPETVANFFRRFVAELDAIDEANHPLKQARARLRALEKAAANHGINVKSLMRSAKGMRSDPQQFQRDIEADVQIARILRMPVGAQLDLLPAVDLTPVVELHVKMTGIEHKGYRAGRTGIPKAENPHTPGTEEYVKWEEGWLRGNRKHLPEGGGVQARKGSVGSGPELALVSDNTKAEAEKAASPEQQKAAHEPTKGSQQLPPAKPEADGTKERFVKRHNGMWTDHEGIAHDGDVVPEGRLLECYDGGFQAWSAEQKVPFETMPSGYQPAEERYWKKGWMAANTAHIKTGAIPDTGDLNKRLLAASERYNFQAHKSVHEVINSPETEQFFCDLLVAELPEDVGPKNALVATFEWRTAVMECGGSYPRSVMENLYSDKWVAFIDASKRLVTDLEGFVSTVSEDIPASDVEAAKAWIDEIKAFIVTEGKAIRERAEATALVGNDGPVETDQAPRVRPGDDLPLVPEPEDGSSPPSPEERELLEDTGEDQERELPPPVEPEADGIAAVADESENDF